jgi:hypothetical protein
VDCEGEEMKYRKKPVIIEAEQFFHDRPLPFRDRGAVQFDNGFFVETIHLQRCNIVDGDWIIPEPDGVHFYPCKPDIFEMTYEPVE